MDLGRVGGFFEGRRGVLPIVGILILLLVSISFVFVIKSYFGFTLGDFEVGFDMGEFSKEFEVVGVLEGVLFFENNFREDLRVLNVSIDNEFFCSGFPRSLELGAGSFVLEGCLSEVGSGESFLIFISSDFGVVVKEEVLE